MCPRQRKAVRRRVFGAAIGGCRICLPMEGDGFVGLYTSCDHEVEAGMGGAHGVGDVDDVGGGG